LKDLPLPHCQQQRFGTVSVTSAMKEIPLPMYEGQVMVVQMFHPEEMEVQKLNYMAHQHSFSLSTSTGYKDVFILEPVHTVYV
jgi:hypothetical protein